MSTSDWLTPPYEPTTLPPWWCGSCGQRNCGWSRECGRCETVPEHVAAISRPAVEHTPLCQQGRHFQCGVMWGQYLPSGQRCRCACHEIFQTAARQAMESKADMALVHALSHPYVVDLRTSGPNTVTYVTRAGWEKLLRHSNGDPEISKRYFISVLNEMGTLVDRTVFR